jgi:hypothetical protein
MGRGDVGGKRSRELKGQVHWQIVPTGVTRRITSYADVRSPSPPRANAPSPKVSTSPVPQVLLQSRSRAQLAPKRHTLGFSGSLMPGTSWRQRPKRVTRLPRGDFSDRAPDPNRRSVTSFRRHVTLPGKGLVSSLGRSDDRSYQGPAADRRNPVQGLAPHLGRVGTGVLPSMTRSSFWRATRT